MALDPNLPKQLLHLLEKRQSAGRRKQDGAQTGLPANEKPSASTERRKVSRRKAKSTTAKKSR